MAKTEQYITATVTLVYPKVSTPDTYGPKADGKFKTDFRIEGDTGAKIVADLKAKAKALMPDVKKPKYPWRKVTDKEDNETGEVLCRASSKFQPMVTDAKGQEIPVTRVADMRIGAGTVAKVALGLNPYDGRLSLYLNGLQIIKLVQYEVRGKPEFKEEEGFSYDGPMDEKPEAEKAKAKPKASETDDDEDDEIPF